MDHQQTVQQLGGQRTLAMVGTKGLVAGQNSLVIMVGTNTKRVSKVAITLVPSDTYSLAAYSKNGEKKEERTEVFCDQLQEVFLEMVGVLVRLL